MKTNYLWISLLALSTLALSACHRQDDAVRQGYIETRLIYVSSQGSGTLDKLDIKRGESVKQGQQLFQLDPNPQLSAVHQAQAQLQQAKANLANLEKGKRPTELAAIEAQQKSAQAQLIFAKKTFDRYTKLYQKRVIQKSKLDEAAANYKNLQGQFASITANLKTAKMRARADEIKAAEASVRAAGAALQQAKWQLNQKTIRSPKTGDIFDTYFRAGEMVPSGNPVLSILTPQNTYAVFFIPEEELSTTKINQTVQLTCDSCKAPITATIYFISPQAEYTPPIIYSEKSRSKLVYRVEARLKADDAKVLRPGQPVTVFLNAGKTHAK